MSTSSKTVTQLTLLRILQAVSVLSHAWPYNNTTPSSPPSTTHRPCWPSADCLLHLATLANFMSEGHAVTTLLLNLVFPWIRVTDGQAVTVLSYCHRSPFMTHGSLSGFSQSIHRLDSKIKTVAD